MKKLFISCFMGLSAFCIGSKTASAETAAADKPLNQQLSDAQIAKIMVTANENEIAAAKIAKDNAKSTDVIGFAQKMLNAHEANEKMGKEVAKKQKIGFDDSDANKQLKEDGKKTFDALKDPKGQAFDAIYMSSQMEMHQKLLNDLDTVFIPVAQNPALKDYLQQTRKHVKMHLEQAKALTNKKNL